MPKVWLCQGSEGNMYFLNTKSRETCYGRPIRQVEVGINNSLLRQIEAAETKYLKFQDAMENWLEEAEAGRLKRISDGR